MKRKARFWALLTLLLISLGLASASRGEARRVGHLKFPAPLTEADRKYLGLERPGAFTLQDVPAPYVLVEVLNSNCPHCMEQAPALNKLYKLVAGSDLKDRLKFIGVVSNPVGATNWWKTTYKVPFPLLSDPDWEIAGALKISGTPTTVVLAKDGKVVYLEDGVFGHPEKVLKVLKTRLK